MALGEFEIIRRFFSGRGAARTDVFTGVGDDAALVLPREDRLLASCIDTLVEGVHFPPATPARDLGHRALAVTLSDIAAMGADPVWALLSLTIPDVDERWLEEFANGFSELASRYQVALIGGDLTRGPRAMTVHAQGYAPPMLALAREGAAPGDAVFVTGAPGDAAGGLAVLLGKVPPSEPAAEAELLRKFLRPEPRIEAGLSLHGVASAAIDVSDGLIDDAGKLGRASDVGLRIDVASLPLSESLRTVFDEPQARRLALGGGDDYELLFTVPRSRLPRFEAAREGWSWPCERIGTVHPGAGASAWLDGRRVRSGARGHRHF